MKVFFDCEFTGLHKETTLISIGLISENGKSFYAELTDYNSDQCDEWIKNNVIKNLYLKHIYYESGCLEKIEKLTENGYVVSPSPNIPEKNALLQYDYFKPEKNGDMAAVGQKCWVGVALEEWFNQFDDVELVSDVCHYDMVLLIDLFGNAFDLPENVGVSCHDINQDIARHYGISNKEAFDKSREEIVLELCGKQIQGEKHNSLYDAKVIKAIYEGIVE